MKAAERRARDAGIVALAKEGLGPTEIGRRVGVSYGTVRVVLAQARAAGVWCPPRPPGRSGRSTRVWLSPSVQAIALGEAMRRQVSVRKLVGDIATAVLEHDLVKAVLDDEVAA